MEKLAVAIARLCFGSICLGFSHLLLECVSKAKRKKWLRYLILIKHKYRQTYGAF